MDSEGEPQLVNQISMVRAGENAEMFLEGIVMQSWFQYSEWDGQGTDEAASYMNFSCS